MSADLPAHSEPLLLSFPDIKTEFDKIIARYHEANADGKVTLKEWWDILVGAAFDLTAKAREFVNLSPEERKTLIVEGVDLLYEKVIAPLDIPGIPNFIENRFVDPVIGKAISPIVSSLIDGILRFLDKTDQAAGEPVEKETPTGESPTPADSSGGDDAEFKPY